MHICNCYMIFDYVIYSTLISIFDWQSQNVLYKKKTGTENFKSMWIMWQMHLKVDFKKSWNSRSNFHILCIKYISFIQNLSMLADFVRICSCFKCFFLWVLLCLRMPPFSQSNVLRNEVYYLNKHANVFIKQKLLNKNINRFLNILIEKKWIIRKMCITLLSSKWRNVFIKSSFRVFILDYIQCLQTEFCFRICYSAITLRL